MSDKVFTEEELAKYNGENGSPKYVAVDGVVYDVSAIQAWSGENHHGNTPGHDVTEAIEKAPHKKKVLAKLPVIGKLTA